MTPEMIHLLNKHLEMITTDLDDLQIMINRKQKEYIAIQTLIYMHDTDMEEQQEKVVIDCVNIDDEDVERAC